MTDLTKSLTTLAERFEAMASVRHTSAAKLSDNHEFRLANIVTEGALVYSRCAAELRRVIAGETPPPPGQEWARKENEGQRSKES